MFVISNPYSLFCWQDIALDGSLGGIGGVTGYGIQRGLTGISQDILQGPPVWLNREQAAFDEANARYYESVDWALDISEARFEGCSIRRVIARLIKRDPETQVVMTRERALLGEWEKLDLSKTYWATSIQLFLNRGDPDVVLVAPKRHPKLQDYLEGLKMLRDAGVAEPD